MFILTDDATYVETPSNNSELRNFMKNDLKCRKLWRRLCLCKTNNNMEENPCM